MKNTLLSLLIGVLCLGSTAGAQQPRQRSRTVADSINYIWKNIERDITMLAEAMPDDAWNFKPRAGAFENARTFAEQIKHVACSNLAFADQTLGEKPPERCEAGGPDPAKTKTELMNYLRDSFRKMDDAISRTNDKNMLQLVETTYAGDNRLSTLIVAVWHISDHYGQLVEYLRLNGIVPPASR
jgi:hypothetical protein